MINTKVVDHVLCWYTKLKISVSVAWLVYMMLSAGDVAEVDVMDLAL